MRNKPEDWTDNQPDEEECELLSGLDDYEEQKYLIKIGLQKGG